MDEEGGSEEENTESGMRDAVADQAAAAILSAELPRFVEKIRRLFSVKGLDAVYYWYPED